MIFKPEGWVVLKSKSEENDNLYLIFGSWREGDRWRLSSGSKSLPHLSDCGNYWIWPQVSGSIYELPVGEENCYTFYTGAVLDNLLAIGYRDGTQLKRISLEDIVEDK